MVTCRRASSARSAGSDGISPGRAPGRPLAAPGGPRCIFTWPLNTDLGEITLNSEPQLPHPQNGGDSTSQASLKGSFGRVKRNNSYGSELRVTVTPNYRINANQTYSSGVSGISPHRPNCSQAATVRIDSFLTGLTHASNTFVGPPRSLRPSSDFCLSVKALFVAAVRHTPSTPTPQLGAKESAALARL